MAPAPGPSLGSTGVMLAGREEAGKQRGRSTTGMNITGKQSGGSISEMNITDKQRSGSTTGMNIAGKRANTPDSLGGSNGYFTQVLFCWTGNVGELLIEMFSINLLQMWVNF